jgi:hypothetical protein
MQIYGDTSQTLAGWPHKNISNSNCEVHNIKDAYDWYAAKRQGSLT